MENKTIEEIKIEILECDNFIKLFMLLQNEKIIVLIEKCLNKSDKFKVGAEHATLLGYLSNESSDARKIVIKFYFNEQKIFHMSKKHKDELYSKYTKIDRYVANYKNDEIIINNVYILKTQNDEYYWLEDYVEGFKKFNNDTLGTDNVIFSNNLTLLKFQKYVFESEGEENTIIDLQGGVTTRYILCYIEYIDTIKKGFDEKDLLRRFKTRIDEQIESYKDKIDLNLKDNFHNINKEINTIHYNIENINQRLDNIDNTLINMEKNMNETLKQLLSSIEKSNLSEINNTSKTKKMKKIILSPTKK